MAKNVLVLSIPFSINNSLFIHTVAGMHISLYISSVLHRSMFDMAIVIFAIVLLQRYNEGVRYADNVYDLFLSSYIAATKVMDRPSVTSEFWYFIADDTFLKELRTFAEL